MDSFIDEREGTELCVQLRESIDAYSRRYV